MRRNIAWNFAGNAVYAACQWAMLIVLAKAGSPEMVGTFAFALGVTAPIVMLANLQLRAVQATDARERFLFCDYFGLRLLTTAAALCLCCAIACFGTSTRSTAATVGLVAIAKSAESLGDLVYGLFQHHEQMHTIAVSMIYKGCASLAVFSAALLLHGGLLCACATLALAWSVILLAFDFPRARRLFSMQPYQLWPRWDWPRICSLARLAAPLGVVMGLISLNVNVPRYLIEAYLGPWSLGIFSALVSINLAGATVINAIGQSASPRLARLFAAGRRREFISLTAKLALIGGAVGLGGAALAGIAGRQIVTLLFRPEYARGAGLLTGIMVAGAIGYVSSIAGYALTAAGCFRPQLPMLAAALITTAVLSWWLVPTTGIRGAVIGVCGGNGVLTFTSVVALHRLLRSVHPMERTAA